MGVIRACPHLYPGLAMADQPDRRAALLQTHKYMIGQSVRYSAGPFTRIGADAAFKVVRLMPPDGGEHQYRIKSTGEAFERVAKESQLDRD